MEPKVAYFCMEYGLNPAFRIYSGGLGILAGDILKAANDLKKPMVAVGFLWRQGYTRQTIDEDGRIVDSFPEYRYGFLKDTGVEVSVTIRKRVVRAKVWLCDCYGNVPLYLLDTFLDDNSDRLLTGQLYGWFDEERIAQEMLLGIGGIRALEKLGITPDVYHFNDSHPIFAGMELVRKEMLSGADFEKAVERVRQHIVFTTHTPVPAGNEVHSFPLLRYMGAFGDFTSAQMKKIGGNPFNMTAAGLRLSCIANGVSALHGEVARGMWKKVTNSAQIISITNGVHNGTWQADEICKASGDKTELLAVHKLLKKRLFEEIERRNGVKLNEEALTIGFARRAAPYKRGDLIFSNPEIIEPLLRDGKLQLIFSGKAHPNDVEGKKIVMQMYLMAQKYPNAIVFLQDYDMTIGAMMTRGCDVWMNTPRRPMEASGTSGMKAAMNGVLNFSVLDGWWPEGCEHGVNGWQIGDGYEGDAQDEHDSASLYKTLLDEILPAYQDRDAWACMMQASIEMSEKPFSAARMVSEYYEKMYSRCRPNEE